MNINILNSQITHFQCKEETNCRFNLNITITTVSISLLINRELTSRQKIWDGRISNYITSDHKICHLSEKNPPLLRINKALAACLKNLLVWLYDKIRWIIDSKMRCCGRNHFMTVIIYRTVCLRYLLRDLLPREHLGRLGYLNVAFRGLVYGVCNASFCEQFMLINAQFHFISFPINFMYNKRTILPDIYSKLFSSNFRYIAKFNFVNKLNIKPLFVMLYPIW